MLPAELVLIKSMPRYADNTLCSKAATISHIYLFALYRNNTRSEYNVHYSVQ